MEWVLLIYLYAGVFAKGDSVAVTTIPGYRTQIECEEAARDLPKGAGIEIEAIAGCR